MSCRMAIMETRRRNHIYNSTIYSDLLAARTRSLLEKTRMHFCGIDIYLPAANQIS